ncbi:hypothetical protein IC235_06715 [Hymenobacter sp. BT664]|uniref:Uncharacterized protein n=1 Tax=Hymenobacter montanus TaxID=2771359 RepID=A0A927BBU8_9BACT|nr:hypothetical protein [Hymenobacter montanus]MBD2767581.1 hypothetical protein [Hymenobacter montanus]
MLLSLAPASKEFIISDSTRNMALPKKGLRKITVNDCRYAWSVTGNDYVVHLSIVPLDNLGRLLTTEFGYHSKLTGKLHDTAGKVIGYSTKQQLIITPYIVRQVIQYALSKGWEPKEKGPQLHLPDIEGMIDLRLAHED